MWKRTEIIFHCLINSISCWISHWRYRIDEVFQRNFLLGCGFFISLHIINILERKRVYFLFVSANCWILLIHLFSAVIFLFDRNTSRIFVLFHRFVSCFNSFKFDFLNLRALLGSELHFLRNCQLSRTFVNHEVHRFRQRAIFVFGSHRRQRSNRCLQIKSRTSTHTSFTLIFDTFMQKWRSISINLQTRLFLNFYLQCRYFLTTFVLGYQMLFYLYLWSQLLRWRFRCYFGFLFVRLHRLFGTFKCTLIKYLHFNQILKFDHVDSRAKFLFGLLL